MIAFGTLPHAVTDISQRWDHRKDRYKVRPPEERIDPSRYEVEPLSEGPSKAYILEHHYSASYPAARCNVGLFERQLHGQGRRLVGVCVFSVPMQKAVIPCYAPKLTPNEGVELGRLVLGDEVPFYGESFFVTRAFRVLHAEKPDVKFIVSYSDPVPRKSDDGSLVMPGHVGTIYQALNARYFGRGSRRGLWMDANGIVLSDRMLNKVRTEDSRMEYGIRQLLRSGAPERRRHESYADWVTRALKTGPFHKVMHPGNHVYGWGLGHWKRKLIMAQGLSTYPKQKDVLVQ